MTPALVALLLVVSSTFAQDLLPTPQAIMPGSTGTFVVRLPNDPAVRTYHVVAIGR